MAHSALVDVADAVFHVLNVASLTAPPPIGAGGKRIVDQPVVDGPQSFPFVWYELASERQDGGLGAGPWQFEIDIRIHVFSQAAGMQEAQAIVQEAIRLLRTVPLVVAGWRAWYQPHDATITLPFELLNGVPVRELVSEHRLVRGGGDRMTTDNQRPDPAAGLVNERGEPIRRPGDRRCPRCGAEPARRVASGRIRPAA